MAICPHCQATSENLLDPCPTGDGYFCVDEDDYAANSGDDLLGVSVGGRFIVESLLGSGSMSRVYRARQIEVDRTVALKVFRIEEIFDPREAEHTTLTTARDRFAQEARVLGKLAHPNCVTLFDFGADEQGRFLYIAMEHIGGFSLRRAMNRGLKAEAILEIAHQVLCALREAHALEIVHRDLKPENIIMSFRHGSDEPVLKVVDFGIAKLLGQERRMDRTRVGALFGTPAYMSPEQCRGDVNGVGAHSDIYALGCILFEMVTGHLPYESKIPVEMLRMHIDAPMPELAPRSGLDIPDGLSDFILKCIQKEPAARFSDAQSALTALSAFRGGAVAPRQRPMATRVVVPKNQISGVDIEPPMVPQIAGTPQPGPVKVETRSQLQSADGVYDTHRGRGSVQPSAPSEAAVGKAIVLVAFVLLSVACVTLFYFLWETVAKA